MGVLCFPLWEASLREASSTLGILPSLVRSLVRSLRRPKRNRATGDKAWRVPLAPRQHANTPVAAHNLDNRKPPHHHF